MLKEIMILKINKKLISPCISKINKTFVDNAEDLNIVVTMYILLEYSENYSMTPESLWNSYRNKINDDVDKNGASNSINNNKKIISKSFEYRAKIIGRTPDDNNTLDTEAVVLLKYLSNFWRFLDLPLIDCEIEFDL